MLWITATLGVLAAGPSASTSDTDLGTLSLVPNRAEILQGDVLLARTVFHNRDDKQVKLEEPDGKPRGYYFRIQIKQDAHWSIVRTVGELVGESWGEPGTTCVLAKSTYAEYRYLHRHKGDLLFGQPGVYRLRAVTRVDGLEVYSEEVPITVKARVRDDLKRVANLGPSAGYFGFESLKSELPAGFISLSSLGGNIEANIESFQLLQEFTRSGKLGGEHISLEEFLKACKERMDVVSYERGLSLLAGHYMPLQNANGLSTVLDAMPYDSDARREATGYLLRRFAGPGVNVPDSPCQKEP